MRSAKTKKKIEKKRHLIYLKLRIIVLKLLIKFTMSILHCLVLVKAGIEFVRFNFLSAQAIQIILLGTMVLKIHKIEYTPRLESLNTFFTANIPMSSEVLRPNATLRQLLANVT